MTKSEYLTRMVLKSGALLAWVALSGGLAGCKTPSGRGSGWLTFKSCAALTNAFRGFHQESFPTNWVCEDGVLHSIPGRSVDLITREKYQDFDLQLDWKVSVRANSGILYGVTEATKETYWSGPEMQINDDPAHPDDRIPNHSAGALYDLMAPNDEKHLKATGEYNHARLISRKGHVEHWLNGKKIIEYDWESDATRELIKQSKFKDAPFFMQDRNGHIALQHHGDEVWFRNIRIRRLER